MTNKKRVTVYIDKGIWNEVKETAWKERVSASLWLEGAIKGTIRRRVLNEPGGTVRMERKIEVVIPDNTTSELSPREKYKLSHPRETCPNCQRRNVDCECGEGV